MVDFYLKNTKAFYLFFEMEIVQLFKKESDFVSLLK